MLSIDQLNNLLSDASLLKNEIAAALDQRASGNSDYLRKGIHPVQSSAVLFLLAPGCGTGRGNSEPCLILNKRSARVRQPGDLCCPGGSISITKDNRLAKILRFPFTPLTRWRFWHRWVQTRNQEASNLSFLLATGIRESYEEMRLNPFGLRFLGPLPPQQLVMFERTIFPMVCWVPRQKKFKTNWEVDRIVNVPIRHLLEPVRYARFRLAIDKVDRGGATEERVFPCFVPEDGGGTEMLWGVTFRLTMAFLEVVFGFEEPHIDSLPEVDMRLKRNYLTGNGQTIP